MGQCGMSQKDHPSGSADDSSHTLMGRANFNFQFVIGRGGFGKVSVKRDPNCSNLHHFQLFTRFDHRCGELNTKRQGRYMR